MSFSLYLSFCFAVIILGLIPGPNVAVIAATSLHHGVRAGLLTVLGTSFGLAAQLFIVSLGLSALLDFMVEALFWLRFLGVAYLLYLAVRSLAAVQAANEKDSVMAAPHQIGRQSLLIGAMVAFFNPKTFLFLMAFLPQFIHPTAAVSFEVQFFTLSVLYLAVLGAVDCGWVLIARSFLQLVGGSVTFGRIIHSFLLLLAALALSLARRS